MLTNNDILTTVYALVKLSPIDALNGGIYKRVRPTDSVLEDCIISLFTGGTRKFLQDGAIFVKIFYNDINSGNTYYEDTARGGELERLLLDLSEVLLKNNDYSFDIQSRESYTEAVADLHQHFAILKINFQIINN